MITKLVPVEYLSPRLFDDLNQMGFILVHCWVNIYKDKRGRKKTFLRLVCDNQVNTYRVKFIKGYTVESIINDTVYLTNYNYKSLVKF